MNILSIDARAKASPLLPFSTLYFESFFVNVMYIADVDLLF